MTTTPLKSRLLVQKATPPLPLIERLRQDSTGGCAGQLIVGSLGAIAGLVRGFTNTQIHESGNPSVKSGASVVVAGAGTRGLMGTFSLPARRDDHRFANLGASSTLADEEGFRWLEREIQAMQAHHDVRVLPTLVLIEPSAAGELTHTARQRLDRLAKETGVLIALVSEDAEVNGAKWLPTLFDDKEKR